VPRRVGDTAAGFGGIAAGVPELLAAGGFIGESGLDQGLAAAGLAAGGYGTLWDALNAESAAAGGEPGSAGWTFGC
jgi:hypothetical protein